jgi:hypothetical protein
MKWRHGVLDMRPRENALALLSAMCHMDGQREACFTFVTRNDLILGFAFWEKVGRGNDEVGLASTRRTLSQCARIDLAGLLVPGESASHHSNVSRCGDQHPSEKENKLCRSPLADAGQAKGMRATLYTRPENIDYSASGDSYVKSG